MKSLKEFAVQIVFKLYETNSGRSAVKLSTKVNALKTLAATGLKS